KVRTHGTPYQIVRDQAAIDSYLGQKYLNRDYGSPGSPAPATVESQQVASVPGQDEVRDWVHGLMGNAVQFGEAVSHILPNSALAVPALLEAMDKSDMELRRRAYSVLHHITGGRAVFDPYAPLKLRQQQLAALQEQLLAAAR